jgi:hypothetical protein
MQLFALFFPVIDPRMRRLKHSRPENDKNEIMRRIEKQNCDYQKLITADITLNNVHAIFVMNISQCSEKKSLLLPDNNTYCLRVFTNVN